MHRPLAPRSWRQILSVAVAGLLLDIAVPARAAIIVSVQDVSATAGTSGNTLEVDVTNTGAPVDIAAFSFEISVAGSSGISFTGADINTVMNPYIFAGHSFFGPQIGTPAGSPLGMALDGSDLATSGSTTLGTGETLGLGRVSFNVAGSTPNGPVTVSLTGFPSTSLTDPNLGKISIDTLNNGAITIGTTAIPEPSSLVCAALGIPIGAWLVRRWRRRPGTAAA